MRTRFFALAAVVLAVLAAACARPENRVVPPVAAVRLDDVPYVAATPGDCGPAALRMVMGRYGRPLSQSEAERLVLAPGGGTTTLDLVLGARALGMRAESGSADFAKLRDWLDRGRPAVALVDYGRFTVRVPHFLVLVGHGTDGGDAFFLAHGPDRPFQRIDERDLAAVWDKTRRVAVFIQPEQP